MSKLLEIKCAPKVYDLGEEGVTLFFYTMKPICEFFGIQGRCLTSSSVTMILYNHLGVIANLIEHQTFIFVL